mgnify:CR=1 FL=1
MPAPDHVQAPGVPVTARVSRLLAFAGGVLCAVALVLLAIGGTVVTLGPLRVSARDPWRLWMEGCVLLVLALVADGVSSLRPTDHRRRQVVALVVALGATLVMESFPRQVGDGGEYLAMARQLSLGRPPAMSPGEVAEAEAWLGTLSGAPPTPLRHLDLVGRDGRQDLAHFWLYPLLAAPWLRAASWLGLHPNHGFALVNIALVALAGATVLRVLPVSAGVLVLLGPLVWWLDKAHADVFIVALGAMAVCLLRSRPAAALALAGLVAAQNPALLPLLLLAALYACWVTGFRERRVWLGALGALAVAGLHPAYYLWHLGVVSPLSAASLRSWPGITALLTPLVDLDLGLAVHAPGLAVALVLGLFGLPRWPAWRERWPEVAVTGVALVVGLLTFAQTPNVNHGGTPGPSRYGLWLMPLAIPALRAMTSGSGSPRGRARLALVAACSVVWSVYAYHPRHSEAGQVEHTALASRVLTGWPSLYAPLPEVFAERTLGYDGVSQPPASTPGCEKVLLAGEGRADVRWPLPCRPAPVPEECQREGALCYANRTASGYAFARAPRQSGYGFIVDRSASWTDGEQGAWRPVVADWDGLRAVRPWSGPSFVRDMEGIESARALQNGSELLLWVTPSGAGHARVRIAAPSGSALWWLDVSVRPPARTGPGRSLEGEAWVDLPGDGPALLLLRRR